MSQGNSMNQFALVTPLSVLNQQASGILQIDWSDGSRSRLSHQRLRASCRCASCVQGRRANAPTMPPPIQTRLTSVDEVGNYGLNLGFNDGHARGIYPWSYLRTILEP